MAAVPRHWKHLCAGGRRRQSESPTRRADDSPRPPHPHRIARPARSRESHAIRPAAAAHRRVPGERRSRSSSRKTCGALRRSAALGSAAQRLWGPTVGPTPQRHRAAHSRAALAVSAATGLKAPSPGPAAPRSPGATAATRLEAFECGTRRRLAPLPGRRFGCGARSPQAEGLPHRPPASGPPDLTAPTRPPRPQPSGARQRPP